MLRGNEHCDDNLRTSYLYIYDSERKLSNRGALNHTVRDHTPQKTNTLLPRGIVIFSRATPGHGDDEASSKRSARTC